MRSLFLTILVLFILFAIVKAWQRGLHIWLPTYIFDKVRQRNGKFSANPIHIMFCLVDHFEPGNGHVSLERARTRVKKWVEHYPLMASRHRDSDGKPPQHTWFYPPHYDEADHLEKIAELCKQGFGEIEVHLHHNRQQPFPETGESFVDKIKDCLDRYSRFVKWSRRDGQRCYGFIHGNWSLANSGGNDVCGVNNEIDLLMKTGCYADFTFPAPDRCQPRAINRLFYAEDRIDRPKSYNTGRPVKVGSEPKNGLMLIQGPCGIRWKSKPFKSRLCIETAEIDQTNMPTPERVDFWINTHIHVSGRPEWIFVKVHCHGALEEDHPMLLGEYADTMYAYLEKTYGDGRKYHLHYVTAREMYNIIKAAEAGKYGNPDDYRDFVLSRHEYTGSCRYSMNNQSD